MLRQNNLNSTFTFSKLDNYVIMAGTTKQKMISAFNESITKASSDCNKSDFAAMDGGSFFIGSNNKGTLIRICADKQAAGYFLFGLVPIIANKTIFFADIDHLPDPFDFNVFLNTIMVCFNMIVTGKVKPVRSCDILVFKREDSARYHIYIPSSFGEISKDDRTSIYKLLNNNYPAPVVDEAAQTIRIEGFQKWDTL